MYMFCWCPEKYFIVGDSPQGILERGLGLFVASPEALQRKIHFPDGAGKSLR